MYYGEKSTQSMDNVSASKAVFNNDIYNSALLRNISNKSFSKATKLVTDLRLDIFCSRIGQEESIIQIANKIIDWDEIPVGTKLIVPSNANIRNIMARKV